MSEEWLPWETESEGAMYFIDETYDDLDLDFGNFDTPEDNKRERQQISADQPQPQTKGVRLP